MKKKQIEDLVKLVQKEAQKAVESGDSPFGAVLIDRNGTVIAKARNTQYSSNDPTAHAEINLLRKAAKKLNRVRFKGYRIVTNGASCPMCASACLKSQIYHFYYGADHEKTMVPTISLIKLSKLAKNKVSVYPNILKESCTQQILDARKKLGRRPKATQ